MIPSATFPAAWEVPAFDREDFQPRTSRFCVGIPVINEGERFLGQLGRMAALDLKADLVIADGGSSDGSIEAGELRKRNVRTLLVKRGAGRLSAQLRMLFAYSIQEGYDGVVTLDGNGKDGVEAIPSFLKALSEGYDFVQGSRFLPGGHELHTPLDRRLAAKLIHVPIISLAAGFRYTDTTNGFRAFSSRLLLDPRVQPFRQVFDTYNLHYYLSIRAPRLQYRVTEIPVTRVYPPRGRVPSKISGAWGRLEIVKLLLMAAAGRYDPK